MKKILTLAWGIVCVNMALAQNEVDALRYSQLGFGGTARFMGSAGAFGALGADFSTLAFNPAGIAMYRKSEFTLSPGIFIQKTSASYLGTPSDDNRMNILLGNCGIVLAYHNGDTDNNPEWKGVAIGIGYNRTNNFSNRVSIAGNNPNSSMIDTWLADARNTGDPTQLDPFGTMLAWNTWLLDTAGGNYYQWNITNPKTQNKYIESSGSMGETDLTFGGNYGNKLFLGGTFGFPNITYRETSEYSEEFDANTNNGLKDFNYHQELTTKGSGFNFKFGLIYKPVDWLRIGGSMHTPSFFRLHDNWSSNMTTHFSGNTYTDKSPVGDFDYTLTTPLRAMGSIAFVLGKQGFISADYEFVDYSTAHLSSPLEPFLDANAAITKGYAAASNIRVGGELKLNPIALRAGFALYGSPYRSGVDGSRTSITGGFGFREANFSIDFAYVYTMTSDKYYLYSPDIAQPVSLDMHSSQYVMTLGFRF